VLWFQKFDDFGIAFLSCAAGAVCLPQKISYPFSLISSSEAIITDMEGRKLSPALNVIKPGWVLHASPYTLVR
jgi:hypothetical protein